MVLRGLQEEDEDGREEGPVILSSREYTGRVYYGIQARESVYFGISVDPGSVLHGFRSWGPSVRGSAFFLKKSLRIFLLVSGAGFAGIREAVEDYPDGSQPSKRLFFVERRGSVIMLRFTHGNACVRSDGTCMGLHAGWVGTDRPPAFCQGYTDPSQHLYEEGQQTAGYKSLGLVTAWAVSIFAKAAAYTRPTKPYSTRLSDMVVCHGGKVPTPRMLDFPARGSFPDHQGVDGGPWR